MFFCIESPAEYGEQGKIEGEIYQKAQQLYPPGRRQVLCADGKEGILSLPALEHGTFFRDNVLLLHIQRFSIVAYVYLGPSVRGLVYFQLAGIQPAFSFFLFRHQRRVRSIFGIHHHLFRSSWLVIETHAHLPIQRVSDSLQQRLVVFHA